MKRHSRFLWDGHKTSSTFDFGRVSFSLLFIWFNIAANAGSVCEYGGIKIAIVNEDSGADSEKLSLVPGNTITEVI